MGRDRLFKAKDVEVLIAQGRHLVINQGQVLQLDGWLNGHPGGRLAIQHMVGRDASDEINIYHSTSTARTMSAYRIGWLERPWANLVPPIRAGIGPIDHTCTSTIPECVHTEKLLDGPSKAPSRQDITFRVLQEEMDNGIKEYPSLDAETQQGIVSKYQGLHQRVKDDGLYDCQYWEYGKEAIRYSMLFLLFLGTLRAGWYMVSAVCLGLFWHQIMFTAHDAGHRGITHNFVADTLIGMFIADFCCGLSIGWWKSSHNVHHLVTNHPEHDPDIQNVPLFATSLSFAKSLHSTYYDFFFVWDAFADIAVRYQAYTYYPVMAVARFNLYFLSLCHIVSPRARSRSLTAWVRPAELLFMCCYWYLFGYLVVWRSIPTWTLRVAFVLLSHITTMPLHVQITLSHWGMPTSDLGEGESFPQRQLRTTMDVDCPAWLDFIHGGLQFQACHHLFPMVPRHNLRKLQVLVREFCGETKIPYKMLGFMGGNRLVLSRLGEVAHQVKLMVECQLHMAETGTVGH